MEHFPEATFKNHLDENGYPAFFDANGFAMVRVTVCINDKCHTEDFMVLDFRNKAIQNPYSFQVNTALKRGMVKCLAYFGLGHYIYAGEDLPPQAEEDFDREHAMTTINTYEAFDGSGEWLLKVIEHFKANKLEDLSDDQLQQVVSRIASKQKGNTNG